MAVKQPIFVVPLALGAITAGSEVAGHPASHLGRFTSKGLTWRTTSGSPWVRGNLGAAKGIDFCAIVSANAQSSTTHRLRLGTSQAQVDGTAPYDSGSLPFISPAITRDDGLYHSHLEIPSVQSASWWRVDIGAHSGDFEASWLVLGKIVKGARFYNYDHEDGVKDTGSLEWTRTGVPNDIPGVRFRTKQFTLDWLSEAEYETGFRPMGEALGTTGIVYCCFDPEPSVYRQARTFMGKLEKPLVARARRKPGIYGADLQILSMI